VLLMIVIRCCKFRLYPTKEQEQTLIRFAGCRRFVWNWGLRRKQEHYASTGKGLSHSFLEKELVHLKQKSELSWLQDCNSHLLQQVLRDLDKAFIRFFKKKANYPQLKHRKSTPHSMRFPHRVVVIDDHSIKVPNIGLMKAVIHRPIPGIPKSATIKQEAKGAWFIAFVCHIERPDYAPTCDTPVGIDVGLESFTTLHTGEKVKAPKFYRRSERKIKRLHRRLSRAKKGSQNRRKARKRLACAYDRIRNRRTDWLHKQSIGIIRQFDTVCIETLNIRGLVKTKLAKSFSDAAISSFMRMLRYKAEWYGKQVIAIDRFYASSKTCHRCQTKTALTLSDRVWMCRVCETTHDRDVNAAINILHEGLRILAAGQSRG
jgi:putative transposase